MPIASRGTRIRAGEVHGQTLVRPHPGPLPLERENRTTRYWNNKRHVLAAALLSE
jgi:hypothetical protein